MVIPFSAYLKMIQGILVTGVVIGFMSLALATGSFASGGGEGGGGGGDAGSGGGNDNVGANVRRRKNVLGKRRIRGRGGYRRVYKYKKKRRRVRKKIRARTKRRVRTISKAWRPPAQRRPAWTPPPVARPPETASRGERSLFDDPNSLPPGTIAQPRTTPTAGPVQPPGFIGPIEPRTTPTAGPVQPRTIPTFPPLTIPSGIPTISAVRPTVPTLGRPSPNTVQYPGERNPQFPTLVPGATNIPGFGQTVIPDPKAVDETAGHIADLIDFGANIGILILNIPGKIITGIRILTPGIEMRTAPNAAARADASRRADRAALSGVLASYGGYVGNLAAGPLGGVVGTLVGLGAAEALMETKK